MRRGFGNRQSNRTVGSDLDHRQVRTILATNQIQVRGIGERGPRRVRRDIAGARRFDGGDVHDDRLCVRRHAGHTANHDRAIISGREAGGARGPSDSVAGVEDTCGIQARESQAATRGGGSGVEPAGDISHHVQWIAVVVQAYSPSGANASEHQVGSGLTRPNVEVRCVGPWSVGMLVVQKIARTRGTWTDGDESVRGRADGRDVQQNRADPTRWNSSDAQNLQVVVRRVIGP